MLTNGRHSPEGPNPEALPGGPETSLQGQASRDTGSLLPIPLPVETNRSLCQVSHRKKNGLPLLLLVPCPTTTAPSRAASKKLVTFNYTQ